MAVPPNSWSNYLNAAQTIALISAIPTNGGTGGIGGTGGAGAAVYAGGFIGYNYFLSIKVNECSSSHVNTTNFSADIADSNGITHAYRSFEQ